MVGIVTLFLLVSGRKAIPKLITVPTSGVAKRSDRVAALNVRSRCHGGLLRGEENREFWGFVEQELKSPNVASEKLSDFLYVFQVGRVSDHPPP